MTLLWIEWLDSCHTEGWHDEGEFAPPLRCTSIGFLHKETDQSVMLKMTRDENERWNNSITIPKSAITKRKKIPSPKVVKK